LADHNPVAGTIKNEEGSRDRVLSIEELRQIWAATADDGTYSKILRLLMLTACRREEIGALAWDEVAGDVLHLPSARSKNGQTRDIALSRQARAIIDTMPQTGPYLFGRGGKSPFGGWGWNKSKLDRLVQLPAAWTLHDVRRSAATHMAESGIAQPHVVEAILGHVNGHKAGVAGIYNRATYLPEQRAALQWWADFLENAAADNVVPLKKLPNTAV
jgi:integrase